jgi:hypothetical protein
MSRKATDYGHVWSLSIVFKDLSYFPGLRGIDAEGLSMERETHKINMGFA